MIALPKWEYIAATAAVGLFTFFIMYNLTPPDWKMGNFQIQIAPWIYGSDGNFSNIQKSFFVLDINKC